MAEIIIDAKDTIAGRLAAFAAKQALLGNTVQVVNAEKAVITGNQELVVKKYHHAFVERGRPEKGPFPSRMPDRFLRRIIRGMLPWDKPRGREAFKRILCHIGIPEEIKQKKSIAMKGMTIEKLRTVKYITIGEISRAIIGRKQ